MEQNQPTPPESPHLLADRERLYEECLETAALSLIHGEIIEFLKRRAGGDPVAVLGKSIHLLEEMRTRDAFRDPMEIMRKSIRVAAIAIRIILDLSHENAPTEGPA